MTSHADITRSLKYAKSKSGVALIPFTAGYPSMDKFKTRFNQYQQRVGTLLKLYSIF